MTKNWYLQTGKVFMTSSVNELMNENHEFYNFCIKSMRKHRNCDWGDLEQEDIESNDYALENGERILSSYYLPNSIKCKDEKIWIITEWNRQSTTVLFPSEY